MTTRGLQDDHATGPARRQAMLFSVRLWKEEIAGGWEYRGSARDAVSGAFCSFRDWSDLATFMVARLEEADSRDIHPTEATREA